MSFYSFNELMDLLDDSKINYKYECDLLFSDNDYLVKPFKRLGVYNSNQLAEQGGDNNASGMELICSVCKKTFPSAHLLDLHILETHDSYFKVVSEKVPSFSCFLEKCPHKSQTPEERHDHCIMIHNFPNNFRYDNKVKLKPPVVATRPDALVLSFQNLNFGRKAVCMFEKPPRKSKHQLRDVLEMKPDK